MAVVLMKQGQVQRSQNRDTCMPLLGMGVWNHRFYWSLFHQPERDLLDWYMCIILEGGGRGRGGGLVNAEFTTESRSVCRLPWGPAGTSSGICPEVETHVVRTCQAPRQSLQNRPSGHLERCTTLWLTTEDAGWTTSKSGHISPRARTAHKGLLQKRLEEDICWIVCRERNGSAHSRVLATF